MNHEIHNSTENDPIWERLVDGELSGKEYQELLTSCEEDPRRWRRCALAFLEAQAWGREFRGLEKDISGYSYNDTESCVRTAGQAGSGTQTLVDNRVSLPPVSLGQKRLVRSLTLAACLLIAFFLGFLLPKNSDPIEVASPEIQPNVESFAEELPAQDSLSYITLVIDGPAGSPQQRFQLPVIQTDESIDQLLSSQSSSIPPALLSVLKNLGHEVHREREFLPVTLEDGRNIIVPVENLRIRPASAPRFQ